VLLVVKEEAAMALFGKDKTRELLSKEGFEVTSVLYQAMPLSAAPTVYQDEVHLAWAVRMPASEPRIFSYADVLASQVVEDDGTQAPDEAQPGADSFASFVANPMRASRRNAARRAETCFSLGVAVRVRGAEGALLQLPFIASRTSKSSDAYRRIRAEADALHEAFEAMGRHGERGR
jgi:hypothetical protein